MRIKLPFRKIKTEEEIKRDEVLKIAKEQFRKMGRLGIRIPLVY